MKTKTSRDSQNYRTYGQPRDSTGFEPQAATPSTNPLRPYTKIIDVTHHNEMKEEAQQVNFDDLSLGTAGQGNTPSDVLAGGQALQGDSNHRSFENLASWSRNHHRGLKVMKSMERGAPFAAQMDGASTEYQSQPYRSQTAASQYAAQARNLHLSNMSARGNNTSFDQPMVAMRKTVGTDFTKVKMTRSVYRQHQERVFQEIGVAGNVRPLTRQSGMGKLILRKGQSREPSSQEQQKGTNQFQRRTAPQFFKNIVQNSRNLGHHHQIQTDIQPYRQSTAPALNQSDPLNQTQSTLQKGKDGGYISFQTNVDNSQAIIPMILSNEDLLRTGTDDAMNATGGSSSEDLKKTIISKQVNQNYNAITVNNQAPKTMNQDLTLTQRHKQQSYNNHHQIYENLYMPQTNSQDHSQLSSKRVQMNILSDMQITDASFTKIVPNYTSSNTRPVTIINQQANKRQNLVKSRNHHTLRQGKSVQNPTRPITQLQDQDIKASHFQAIQQVKSFGFSSIPDFKQMQLKNQQDTHFRKYSRQSQAEGRTTNEYSLNNWDQAPLFLSSSKKGPGLQKECAGSYGNVINNRTCLGQKSVFKFSMDLPLKLKQQMWHQHQQEKEFLMFQSNLDSNTNADLKNVSTAQVQTSIQNLMSNPLEIVGSSSRFHLDKSISLIYPNNFESGTQLHIEPNTWSQSGDDSQNLGGVITAEISKNELISPYRDLSRPQAGLQNESKHNGLQDGADHLKSPSNRNSKIIYSLNKSTRNKNSPQRSRNFLYQSEIQLHLKKSQDSKMSKKSTISKQLGPQYVDQHLLDSGFLSSLGGQAPNFPPYQDDQEKETVDFPVIRSQENSFHIPRSSKHKKTESQNEDLAGHLISTDNPAAHDYNVTQISIKVDSKRTNTLDAIRAKKKVQSKNTAHPTHDSLGQFQESINANSMGSFGRQGSASSIQKSYQNNQVRRRERQNVKELKIQRLYIYERKESQRSNQEETQSYPIRHEVGPSISSPHDGAEQRNKYQSVRAKMVESRTNQLKARSRSVKTLNESQVVNNQKVLTLIASVHGNLIPIDQALLQSTPLVQSDDKNNQEKDSENKTSAFINKEETKVEEFKRQDSAFTQQSEGGSSSFDALHLQLIKREQPTQIQSNQVQPIPPAQPAITMEVQHDAQDPYPSRKSFKQVLSKHHTKPPNDPLQGDQSPGLLRIQTEMNLQVPSQVPLLDESYKESSPQLRQSTSQNNINAAGSKVSIIVGQVEIMSPQKIQQQIDDAVFGNQIYTSRVDEPSLNAKRSTITINDEDESYYGKEQQAIKSEEKKYATEKIDGGPETQKFSTSHCKDSSIMDDGDRYQIAAPMMEKVVVKSPGRETTDHVKTGGAPQPFTLSSLISEVPVSLHQKKNSSNSRRQSIKSRRLSQDLIDVKGCVPRTSHSPKRTVLIKKSRGPNDISELIIQNNEISDHLGNKAESTMTKTKQTNLIQRANPITTTQIYALDDLQNSDFIQIQNQLDGLVPINDARRDLPRHGTAAPSVIRRNKETMRRKKGAQPTQSRQTTSQEPTSACPPNDILSATFHVIPINTVQRPNTQGDQGNASFRKSKTPNNQTVYQHTSKMQTLVIHQSELAIDSGQQRMQMKLIQAYNNHQSRMLQLNPDLSQVAPSQQQLGILRVVPVIMQNKSDSYPQQSVPVLIAGLQPHNVLDSFDDLSSLNALHRIIEEAKSKDSSIVNTTMIARGAVGDSISLSKINGWRDSKDNNPLGLTVSENTSFVENPILRDSLASRSQNPVQIQVTPQNLPQINQRRNSRNKLMNLHGKTSTHRSYQASKKPTQTEENLSIIGKNLKS